MTGAIVGAGLTGSGMGLLGGAALGASINVIRKSSTLSEMLFGKEDKRTGKMTGGFFDRDVSTSSSVIPVSVRLRQASLPTIFKQTRPLPP